jgi:hypothetical protein
MFLAFHGLESLHELRRCEIKAGRNFQPGQLLFVEEPIAACLSAGASGVRHCDFCLSDLDLSDIDPDSLPTCTQCGDCSDIVFCSLNCLDAAIVQYHKALCPSRSTYANKLYRYCQDNGKTYPLLITRFVAQMVWKQNNLATKVGRMEQAEEWEQLERLPSKDLTESQISEMQQEWILVRDALKEIAAGADECMQPNRDVHFILMIAFAHALFDQISPSINMNIFIRKNARRSKLMRIGSFGSCSLCHHQVPLRR